MFHTELNKFLGKCPFALGLDCEARIGELSAQHCQSDCLADLSKEERSCEGFHAAASARVMCVWFWLTLILLRKRSTKVAEVTGGGLQRVLKALLFCKLAVLPNVQHALLFCKLALLPNVQHSKL